MADHSGIEWTDATWNPTIGCTKVSPGCDRCYAERMVHRFPGTFPNGFRLTLRPETLELPRRWRRPRMVFVNSMSDLFHRDVPTSYIADVFSVMADCPRHTFQLLTKRSHRLVRLADKLPWPVNVWVGVSIEHSQYLWRAEHLRDVPAAVRFVSAEPLLGSLAALSLDRIDWVIAGGESQPGARSTDLAWFRELRELCSVSRVPFFLKQLGGHPDKRGGVLANLDGRRWCERPRSEQRPLPASVDSGDLLKVVTRPLMPAGKEKPVERSVA
jgi:protein gp37